MTEPTERSTVLPPDEPPDDLLAALPDEEGTATALVGPDGTQIELPAEVADALRHVVATMAQGSAVTMDHVRLSQTTQEAADFLGMGRETLRELLDEGEIPFERADESRRVLLADLLEYRERRRAKTRESLDALVELSHELGLYEKTATPIRTR